MRKPLRPAAFFVGAPKSGSSALSNFLAQHTEVSVSSPKELNFFCRDLDLPRPRHEGQYLAHFTTTERTTILLDASILSLYSKEAAREIAAYEKEARILVMLRDPVEAIASWHQQMVFTGNEPIADLGQALTAEEERRRGFRLPRAGTAAKCPGLLLYRDVMRYGEQLERYLGAFRRQQLHVVLFEQFRARPIETYRNVLHFLGVDPQFSPELREVNIARIRRSAGLHAAMKTVLAAPARRVLPLSLRVYVAEWLDRLNSRPAERIPVPGDVRERLRDEMASDVRKLSDLLDRDVASIWWGTKCLPGGRGDSR